MKRNLQSKYNLFNYRHELGARPLTIVAAI